MNSSMQLQNSNSIRSGEEGKSENEDSNTRSGAINLIRARTLTRSSTPRNSQENLSCEQSGDIQRAALIPRIVVMEPPGESKAKKKRKQKLNKIKKKKLDIAGSQAAPESNTLKDTASHSTETKGMSDSARTLTKSLNSGSSASKEKPTPDNKLSQRSVADSDKKRTLTESLSQLEIKGKWRARQVNAVTGNDTLEGIKAQRCPQSTDKARESVITPTYATVLSGKRAILEKPSSVPDQTDFPQLPMASSKLTEKTSAGQLDNSEARSIRAMLSPIPESAKEHVNNNPDSNRPADLETTGSTLMDNSTLTPVSTSTASTGWTNTALQVSPQTTEPSSEPSSSKGIGHRHATSLHHAHPLPPTPPSTTHSHTIATSNAAITNAQGTLSAQKPEGFFWQLDSHGFPCAKAHCEKRCNLWDGATVICPRCGPYSEVRYCSREHLLEDIKPHWLYCGQLVFQHPCRETSIPRRVRVGPPLIPCVHHYDMPERHRQAVHFNMNYREGDYFIFTDWLDFVTAGLPADKTAIRCSNRIMYVVKFDDAGEKDRFRRVLAACLFMTIEMPDLTDYLYRLIRDKLRQANAPNHIEPSLRYQFLQEFNVTIQERITGSRHACETDWDGRNRRNCQDAVCRGEYRRLLGSVGGRGYSRVVETLESTYWILRAARTTHPTVKDAMKRMMGEGYEEVAEEDRRVFRRGDGWDGAGTGDLEIEGFNEGDEE
ncbi:hypothetical protein ASPBRDRAFT_207648 [Aspergillus brasiliensis CBS 101740]|uniref:Uncharacterized protein n=1 Tax=Aspergillus brasiliensis (strain CBS 101740 / IMI 381727 / IBT 21946) TaxID=767769 RepID=A0A1L9UH83_ASPBC|nr:hypothetical protein ASPBRDRAFT_207648 [Aspergillus brasiliensis CBS 101740]